MNNSKTYLIEALFMFIFLFIQFHIGAFLGIKAAEQECQEKISELEKAKAAEIGGAKINDHN